MASPAQVIANRDNAQSSTGPTTQEGKERSSANATKHGLTSAFRILPHEDQSEFDEMLNGYFAEFEPETTDEYYLVQQMAQARWRVLRAQRLESRWLERAAATVDDPDAADSAILDSMATPGGNVVAVLQRYATAADRTYHRNRRALLAARRPRLSPRDQSLLAYMHAPVPPRRPLAGTQSPTQPVETTEPVLDPAEFPNEPNFPLSSLPNYPEQPVPSPIPPQPQSVVPSTLRRRRTSPY